MQLVAYRENRYFYLIYMYMNVLYMCICKIVL